MSLINRETIKESLKHDREYGLKRTHESLEILVKHRNKLRKDLEEVESQVEMLRDEIEKDWILYGSIYRPVNEEQADARLHRLNKEAREKQ